MRLQVKGRNVEVSDSIRRYAEDKLGKLERQLADPTQVELELALEHNPSIADNHVAEATIWTKGPTLRAREASKSYEDEVSRARKVGPFVQIVASATWLSAIDGLCSIASSSSTWVGSASCRSSLPSLSSAYLRIESLTSTFRPLT